MHRLECVFPHTPMAVKSFLTFVMSASCALLLII